MFIYYLNMQKKKKIFPGVILLFFLLFIIGNTVFAYDGEDDIKVIVRTDRTDALYKCGEQAVFLISLKMDGKSINIGNILVRLTLDGGKKIKEQNIQVRRAPRPLKISGTLNEPGILRCTVEFPISNNKYRGYAAAAFAPTLIRTKTERPEDFDEFWLKGQSELKDIPFDARLTLLPEYSNAKHRCFKINLANINNTRVYGFLNVPVSSKNSRKEAKYSALLKIPGGGVAAPGKPLISNNYLTLYMSVHNYDVGLSKEKYKEFETQYKQLSPIGSSRYYYNGAPNRERYFFRRVVLGIDRVVSYIASRPDFNGKQLIIQGHSQGGFLALAVAGLNRHITGVAANQPGFCDHAGYLAGRKPGAPQLVLVSPKDQREKWLKMSAYFDVVNFAGRIKCPVIVSVGFIDLTCSPSSVYSAYNEIKAQKYIMNMPLHGHGSSNQFRQFQKEWIEKRLGVR